MLLQLFLTELLCAEGKTLFPGGGLVSPPQRETRWGIGSADGLPWCAALGGFLRTAHTWTAGLGPLGDRARAGCGSPDGGKPAGEHVLKHRSALKQKMTWWREVKAQLSFRCFQLHFQAAKVSRVSKNQQDFVAESPDLIDSDVDRMCDFFFVCLMRGWKEKRQQRSMAVIAACIKEVSALL